MEAETNGGKLQDANFLLSLQPRVSRWRASCQHCKVQAAPTGPAGCPRDASAASQRLCAPWPRQLRAASLSIPHSPRWGARGRALKWLPCVDLRDRPSFPSQALAPLAKFRLPGKGGGRGGAWRSPSLSRGCLRNCREVGSTRAANAIPAFRLMQEC